MFDFPRRSLFLSPLIKSSDGSVLLHHRFRSNEISFTCSKLRDDYMHPLDAQSLWEGSKEQLEQIKGKRQVYDK